MQKIVVDLYGADAGIEPVLKGIAKGIKSGINFFPIIVGDEEDINNFFEEHAIPADCYEVINTDKFITNNDPPTVVFAGAEESSMVKAFNRLKVDDDCFAMLSPGNTGALLVGSICKLGLIPGLKFPVLASALPSAGERLVCLVDCGANVDCSANDLVRFAKLGNALSKSFCGIENPRIGLMSVGREKGKGNALTKEAFELLSKLELNFVGNVEGSDLVSGYADVIVTDGFSGNLLLKNAEAVGKAAMDIISKNCEDAETARKLNELLFKRFDFNSQGGATFLGPIKTVVKMHGCANEDTTVACIEQILRLKEGNFAEKISEALR